MYVDWSFAPVRTEWNWNWRVLPSRRMSSKYKSPLIRSRTTSAVSPDAAPQQTAESPAQPSDRGPVDDRFGNGLVFDNRPQSLPDAPRNWRGRGSGSPRFNSPRQNSPRPPRGSPYQWTPPNRHNGSWSSDVTMPTIISVSSQARKLFLRSFQTVFVHFSFLAKPLGRLYAAGPEQFHIVQTAVQIQKTKFQRKLQFNRMFYRSKSVSNPID